MNGLLRAGAALACLVLPVLLDSSNAETAGGSRTAPMQFELRREGPAEACGTKCRTWVSASGAITSDTPRDFESFARGRDLRGATMVLDSIGGSVTGAIALGRAIRRVDMATTVGRTIALPVGKGQEPRATLSPDATCESMCAFVLLGGTRRFVPPEAQVLVHQIWLGDRREDAIAASYTAEDLMIVQRDIGRIALFTSEMGGSIDLLDVALRIPPWEPMRALSYDEIQRMRLSTVTNPFEPAEPALTARAESPAEVTTVAVRASGISERGWSLIDYGGQPVLARRHPMTAEGEEIGSFDVLFTCGPSVDAYAVMYVDRRKSRDDRAASDMLKEATLAVGQKSTTLKVGRNPAFPIQQSGAPTATGVMPASVVKNLADTTSRTLVVSTVRANNAETVIRVGNSGMAQALPKLAAACGKQPSRNVRADLGAGGRQ